MMSRFFRLASLALGIAASGLAPASANGFVVGFVITPAGPAFTELADAYGKKHPGTTIKILPASSKIIIDNLNRDLSDDFVVLGQQWTGNAPRLSDPERVMTTRTIIVLAPGAKGKIASPADLAAHGIRLGNGSAGSGTEALMNATLDRLGAKYGGDFEARLKDDKIDATIIYPADADNAGLDTLDLGDASVPVTEVGAIVKGSANAATVKDFFAFVRSPQGEAILKRHHFDP
jgi:molybdate transport system substrate-binding protein